MISSMAFSVGTQVEIFARGGLVGSAEVGEGGERGAFLATERPLPVGALLRLRVADEERAFVVRSVDEALRSEGVVRGCFGEFVGDEALEKFSSVGSEGLAGGGAESPSPALEELAEI